LQALPNLKTKTFPQRFEKKEFLLTLRQFYDYCRWP
jgi:hypothetical protein